MSLLYLFSALVFLSSLCIVNKVGFSLKKKKKKIQQCVGIPMDTNCSPLLAELLLHDYERNAMIWSSGHPQAESFEFTRRYNRQLNKCQ